MDQSILLVVRKSYNWDSRSRQTSHHVGAPGQRNSKKRCDKTMAFNRYREPIPTVPHFQRWSETFAFSKALKRESVPITWPFIVPGMRASFSIMSFLAPAMVTLLTSRVRPRARS